MNNEQKWQHLATADGSTTVRHPEHSETYHSTFGALTESISVFLTNSSVLARLENGSPTRVLEIGFGTGLNFLLTAKTAASFNCKLDYVAVEIDPLPEQLLADLLHANFPNQHTLISKTIAAATSTQNTDSSTTDAVSLTDLISLCLIMGDALTADFAGKEFHAIYLDAFSPKNNPALWAPPFLCKLRDALASDGFLTSYCVNRRFRDGLTEAGFKWRKIPGPPGKREVLIASV